jgi:SAM-dependent methyltransferase
VTPDRDLDGLRQDWDDLAGVDPLWAILSDDPHRHGGWDLASFFRTGEDEIAALMSRAASLRLPRSRDRALDFGCGVGRLTGALASYFVETVGVDISSRMLDMARDLHKDCPNCVFVESARPDLAQFEDQSFDLVYTDIVLQHLPDRTKAVRYIEEFVRVLRFSGLLVFQMPSRIPLRHALQPRQRLYHILRRTRIGSDRLYRHLGLHPIRMIHLSERDAVAAIEGAGGKVLEIDVERVGSTSIEDRTYFATRPEPGDAATQSRITSRYNVSQADR